MSKRSDFLNRELTVVGHAQSETADKDPKYSVKLESTATIETDNTIIVTVKSQSAELFNEYPLKEKFALKLGTSPQTKLQQE